jgi:SAM-dependent methyltransferase
MENEARVSKAFGKQSMIFDKIYDSNPIVSYMRHLIRQEVLGGLHTNDHILEINAGTGSDALFFAQSGYKVTALEISPEMVNKAQKKIRNQKLENQITFIQKSFEDVSQIEGEFDYVYSNFGGLNCTPNLLEVVHQLLSKLKSGGKTTLTILPPFTLWEKLHVLKGDFKTARRRKPDGPSVARIEGETFNCWYYNPKEIIDSLNGLVSEVSVTGLCIFVPPSFIQSFPNKYPRIFKLLTKIDQKVSKLPFFNTIGDYFMITYTKI